MDLIEKGLHMKSKSNLEIERQIEASRCERQLSVERTNKHLCNSVVQVVAILMVGCVAIIESDPTKTLVGDGGIAGLLYAIKKCYLLPK